MFPPIFLKADLSFDIDQHRIRIQNKPISANGVSGLHWAPLNPKEHFGRSVMATLHILVPNAVSLQTRASISRELSTQADHMGLKFYLDDSQKALLQEIVKEHGFFPTEYLRKFPRIPSDASIPTFPLRVIANLIPENRIRQDHLPIIFEIKNISPNGMLLTTENRLALSVKPGDRMRIVFEPRGEFMLRVVANGLICRIIDEIEPTTGNTIKFFGIKFVSLSDDNQAALLELLKDILERIKGIRT